MLNPFEAIADQQMSAPVKARHRRLEKLVVQSEADAPMVASPADRKMFEQSKQMRLYHAWKREQVEELKSGKYGREVKALIQLLEALTASSAPALVRYVQEAGWLKGADEDTRFKVLGLIGRAIERFRVRQGLAPFDDAIIDEPPTAFEIIRFHLTGVGRPA